MKQEDIFRLETTITHMGISTANGWLSLINIKCEKKGNFDRWADGKQQQKKRKRKIRKMYKMLDEWEIVQTEKERKRN